jgi:hypothetical protein
MDKYNKALVSSFAGVLESFTEGSEYNQRPPQGPPTELPVLSNEELSALQNTVFGEDLSGTGYAYSEITLMESPEPVEIDLPEPNLLEDINICGIDGSNQRIERSSFYFIIARATIVNFRYSKAGLKPYFYNRNRDYKYLTISTARTRSTLLSKV